eukprot:gene17405-765_t
MLCETFYDSGPACVLQKLLVTSRFHGSESVGRGRHAPAVLCSQVDLSWNDESKVQSTLSRKWLHEHRPGQRRSDSANVPLRLWTSEQMQGRVTRHEYSKVMNDDEIMLQWMQDTISDGISIIVGMPPEKDAGEKLANHIAFMRETNFGKVFWVESKPKELQNNIAYTSAGLPLHNDLVNEEFPPGIQFFHCIENLAEGGRGIFIDGFKVVEEFRENFPEHYDLLSTVEIPS